jgi:Glutathione S-transferase, N-terminal domain
MKLYVCFGTFQIPAMRPHPCRLAYEALQEAGYDPDVQKVYGIGPLPDFTPGRREVKRLSGESWVPLLVTDDGEIIGDSKDIIAWAQANPAGAVAAA